MEFMDIRKGSDAEFGQSIYEPFGIAQVEPLGAGALCVVSNVCGCVGFLQRASAGLPSGNVIVGDYTRLPGDWFVSSPWDALWIDRSVRERIELNNSYEVARQVFDRLPCSSDDMQRLLASGQAIASGMTWEVVVTDYLLPALGRL
jgi:hypothetical protein